MGESGRQATTLGLSGGPTPPSPATWAYPYPGALSFSPPGAGSTPAMPTNSARQGVGYLHDIRERDRLAGRNETAPGNRARKEEATRPWPGVKGYIPPYLKRLEHTDPLPAAADWRGSGFDSPRRLHGVFSQPQHP